MSASSKWQLEKRRSMGRPHTVSVLRTYRTRPSCGLDEHRLCKDAYVSHHYLSISAKSSSPPWAIPPTLTPWKLEKNLHINNERQWVLVKHLHKLWLNAWRETMGVGKTPPQALTEGQPCPGCCSGFLVEHHPEEGRKKLHSYESYRLQLEHEQHAKGCRAWTEAKECPGSKSLRLKLEIQKWYLLLYLLW